jgi:hypothetical protein
MFASTLMKAEMPSVAKCFLNKALPTHVVMLYILFAAGAFAVYHHIAEQEFSSILTMAVIMQALAMVFLCTQVVSNGSAAGVSAQGLTLDGIAVGLRLSSTVWLNGYLPVDKTGDHIYQVIDLCTLAMILFLLHRVFAVSARTYQAEEDSFSVGPMMLACFVLAAIFHADMDDNPLFDTLWMTGLFTGVIAVLPQLWLITRSGGRAEAMTCHYMAAMAMSRVLSGIFMWEAREDITCKPWVQGIQHGIIAILIAHAVHLLLLGDFMYFYLASMTNNGIREPVRMDFDLPTCI